MPFGICSAPEEFQRHVNEIIECLEGVTAIADDLLVTGAGNTHEEALADHDRNLIALLQRCTERNFKQGQGRLQTTEVEVLWSGYFTRPSQS